MVWKMATTASSPDKTAAAYHAAHEDAVLARHAQRGMLRLTGATRLDLPNRMSTQGLMGLGSGEGAATVFTTNIGRIIDRVFVYTTSDTVYLLTGDNHAGPLARYLMRNVFFNDDLQLTDISAETAVWGIYGPRAAERLAAAGFGESTAALAELPRHHWREVELGDVRAYVHRTDPIAGDGFFVTGQAADAAAIAGHLAAADIVAIDEPIYDYLRIESGLPRFGHELTLDYIPLEAGLWDDVSFHKGCYIGQEIIARMESRGKLAKRLMQLRPASAVHAGTAILAGSDDATHEVGQITSAAAGPAGPMALGYVRTSAVGEALATADGVALTVHEP